MRSIRRCLRPGSGSRDSGSLQMSWDGSYAVIVLDDGLAHGIAREIAALLAAQPA